MGALLQAFCLPQCQKPRILTDGAALRVAHLRHCTIADAVLPSILGGRV